MGRLTEFQCPNQEFAQCLPAGSPTATLTALTSLTDHVVLSSIGSGWVGIDFIATNISGIYIDPLVPHTFDIKVGSLSFFSEGTGSLNIVGFF